MSTRTRAVLGFIAALTAVGGIVTAQASAHAPDRLSFVSQLTNIEFFTSTGPITGFPTTPLVPGDRIIGQDRIERDGQPVGHDNEACTVSFGRDVLCQDIVILDGRGDLQDSWTFQWPATGTPTSFDGVIDGGTGQFALAHGTFHAAALPGGAIQVTAEINEHP
jgi:hypothetical protein